MEGNEDEWEKVNSTLLVDYCTKKAAIGGWQLLVIYLREFAYCSKT